MNLRKVNGAWKRAVRVHPGDVNPGGSILYEFRDPGFPDGHLGNNQK